ALQVRDLAPARDQHDGAGQPALIDLLLERRTDPLEAFRGQADLLGFDRRQRTAPGGARRKDENKYQGADSLHGTPPCGCSWTSPLATPATSTDSSGTALANRPDLARWKAARRPRRSGRMAQVRCLRPSRGAQRAGARGGAKDPRLDQAAALRVRCSANAGKARLTRRPG